MVHGDSVLVDFMDPYPRKVHPSKPLKVWPPTNIGQDYQNDSSVPFNQIPA